MFIGFYERKQWGLIAICILMLSVLLTIKGNDYAVTKSDLIQSNVVLVSPNPSERIAKTQANLHDQPRAIFCYPVCLFSGQGKGYLDDRGYSLRNGACGHMAFMQCIDATIAMHHLTSKLNICRMRGGDASVYQVKLDLPRAFLRIVELNSFIDHPNVSAKLSLSGFQRCFNTFFSRVSGTLSKPNSGDRHNKGEETHDRTEIGYQEAFVANGSGNLRGVSGSGLLNQIIGLQTMLLGGFCAGISFARGLRARKNCKPLWLAATAAGMVAAYCGLSLFMIGEVWGMR
jgi:hypothetical protein